MGSGSSQLFINWYLTFVLKCYAFWWMNNYQGIKNEADLCDSRRSDHSPRHWRHSVSSFFVFWFILSWGWRGDLSLHHFVSFCKQWIHVHVSQSAWTQHLSVMVPLWLTSSVFLYMDLLASCFLKIVAFYAIFILMSKKLLWSAGQKLNNISSVSSVSVSESG